MVRSISSHGKRCYKKSSYKKGSINQSMRLINPHDMKTSHLSLSLSMCALRICSIWILISCTTDTVDSITTTGLYGECERALKNKDLQNRIDSKLWRHCMGELSKCHLLSWPSVGDRMGWGWGTRNRKQDLDEIWVLGWRVDTSCWNYRWHCQSKWRARETTRTWKDINIRAKIESLY